jgi:hypothetical protein
MLEMRYERLKFLHRRIDAHIREERRRPMPDDTRLKQLKTSKLHVKDRLTKLERLVLRAEPSLPPQAA